MIRSINFLGSALYFFADDMGNPILGGWRDREAAEQRYTAAEDCGWNLEQIDCEVELEMLDDSGRLVICDDESGVKITADEEFAAEEFWSEFDVLYPAIADILRSEGACVVSETTWSEIQEIEGFADGPEYARYALRVVQ